MYLANLAAVEGHAQIVEHLPSWIAARVTFSAERELPGEEVLELLWAALGADRFVISEICSLRLFYKNGFLHVRESARQGAEVYERISFVILRLWQFNAYTDSRWLSVGRACRALVRGWCTGFLDLARQILATDGEPTTWLGRVRRLQGDSLRFTFTVALSSHVPDAASILLLSDGRVAQTAADIRGALREEFDWLAHLPLSVFEILEVHCSVGARELRSDVLEAAQKSSCFMEYRFLQAADALPWSLCRGDLRTNLEAMLAGSCPAEPTCDKMWLLHHEHGWSVERLMPAASLLFEGSWHTATSEQQHASATLVKRLHVDLELEMQCIRAYLHTLRNFLPCAHEGDKLVASLDKSLQRLLRRKPGSVSAQHLHRGHVIRELSHRQRDGNGMQYTGHWQRDVMRGHKALWETAVSESEKRRWEAGVAAHVAGKREQLARDLEDCRSRLITAREQLRQELRLQGALKLSSCKWSPEDFQALQDLFEHESFTHAMVAAAQCPAATSYWVSILSCLILFCFANFNSFHCLEMLLEIQ